MATLTYVYADSTAVLGPLATHAEPHTYDLCADHANRLTVPRGWEVVRLVAPSIPAAQGDELSALADAVREERATDPEHDDGPVPQRLRPPLLEPPTLIEGTRRGHLRTLRTPGDAEEGVEG